MKLNILGTEYTAEYKKPGEDPKLSYCDGYTDWTIHRISVIDPESDSSSVADMEVYKHKVMRHEITHAFLFESGLMQNIDHENSGAYDEMMVDWIAIQGTKLYKVWEQAGVI